MPDTLINCNDVLQAVAESLETMSFISLLPADPPFASPDRPRLYRIEFSGSLNGCIELAASEFFGCTVAAAAMGTSPNAAESMAKEEDAMKELMNVTAGALLRHWEGVGPLEISLPMAGPRLTDTQWRNLVESDDIAVVDAEGCLIAARVVMKA